MYPSGWTASVWKTRPHLLTGSRWGHDWRQEQEWQPMAAVNDVYVSKGLIGPSLNGTSQRSLLRITLNINILIVLRLSAIMTSASFYLTQSFANLFNHRSFWGINISPTNSLVMFTPTFVVGGLLTLKEVGALLWSQLLGTWARPTLEKTPIALLCSLSHSTSISCILLWTHHDLMPQKDSDRHSCHYADCV